MEKLLEGEHFQGFSQCLDNERIAYFSDEEVPNEAWIYSAEPPGGDPKKITEEMWGFWCNSSTSIVLFSASGPTLTMVLHDLQSGQQIPLLTGVVTFTNSPVIRPPK